MKTNFLSTKAPLYLIMFAVLLFTASCANRNSKKETKKIVKESATVKKAAAHEEAQDTVMFKKKLQLFNEFDQNKDNKISEKEYLDIASKKFDKLDVNKDGKLTVAESDLIVPMLSTGQKDVTKAQFIAFYSKKFKTMDKNNDGYVVMEELDVREN